MNKNGKAIKTKSTFRMECTVGIKIKAVPAKIWKLLTDAPDFPRWNSTVESIEGKIAEDEKIKLKATIDPKRTFKLTVSEFEPNKKMIWQDGTPPMFKGVRTFTLDDNHDGTTDFTMTEVFSGLMLPMISGSLPDFVPVFEQYASDLKSEAEILTKQV
jgi:hypothetical protein